jgi:TRIAD3 protein (E3 ubiquitin-protein ligase RNF216)
MTYITNESLIDINALECECCFNHIDLSDGAIQCSSGHLFCKGCIVYLIQTKISEGTSILQIDCINSAEKCDHFIPPKELTHALGADLWAKYMEKYDSENLQKAILVEDSKLEQWFACSYVVEVLQDKNVLKQLECPKCKKKTCRNCHKESHEPFTCDQVKNQFSRSLAAESMTRTIVRHCPNCEKKESQLLSLKAMGATILSAQNVNVKYVIFVKKSLKVIDILK